MEAVREIWDRGMEPRPPPPGDKNLGQLCESLLADLGDPC